MNNQTQITLQAFKTITDSEGQFDTWADIINKGNQTLPLNTEILGTVLRAPQNVVGGTVEFSNVETKDVGYLEDNLTNNNKMTQDKMLMYIYVDYYTSVEYSALDVNYASDWSRILSDVISQMFHTKSDLANAIAIEELYKVSLALGQFLVIPKGDKELYKVGTNEIDDKAYLTLANQLVRYIKDVRAKRTKFAKGIQKNQLAWVISEQFSLSLLSAKTYGFGASDSAYKDYQTMDEVGSILSQQFRTSMYLQRDILMTEFNDPTTNTIVNPNSGTGNKLKPFVFNQLIGLLWFKESLAYFENNIPMREQYKPDSRTETVISYMWRANAAIKPVYARANTIMIASMPKEDAYTNTKGDLVPAKDYSKWADFKQLRMDLYTQQKGLYSKFWNLDGTNTEIFDQPSLDAAIAKNTIKWAGTPISKKRQEQLEKERDKEARKLENK